MDYALNPVELTLHQMGFFTILTFIMGWIGTSIFVMVPVMRGYQHYQPSRLQVGSLGLSTIIVIGLTIRGLMNYGW